VLLDIPDPKQVNKIKTRLGQILQGSRNSLENVRKLKQNALE